MVPINHFQSDELDPSDDGLGGVAVEAWAVDGLGAVDASSAAFPSGRRSLADNRTGSLLSDCFSIFEVNDERPEKPFLPFSSSILRPRCPSAHLPKLYSTERNAVKISPMDIARWILSNRRSGAFPRKR